LFSVFYLRLLGFRNKIKRRKLNADMSGWSRPSRHYNNEMPRFSPKFTPEDDRKLEEAELNLGNYDSRGLRTLVLNRFTFILNSILSVRPGQGSYSSYVGDNGIAIMLFRIFKVLQDTHVETSLLESHVHKLLKLKVQDNTADALFNLATQYNKAAIDYFATSRSRKKRVTLLEGSGGAYALAAVLCKTINDDKGHNQYVKLLLKLEPAAMMLDCDELLYGRMGYVSCLLFVDYYCGTNLAKSDICKRIVEETIREGEKFGKEVNLGVPWMWQWHDSIYLGGAHGVCGILHTFLQLPWVVAKYKKTIKTMLAGCSMFKFKSGNYASSISSLTEGRDRLIHWCHGAPGFAMLFARASEVFADDKQALMKKSDDACSVVWERGLLKKGTGICHGISGNAYTFLMNAKFSKNPEMIYRAAKFAEFMADGKTRFRDADRPLSLFEGVSGEVLFYIDLLWAKNPRFPCYDLVA